MRIQILGLLIAGFLCAPTTEAADRTETAQPSDVCFVTEKYWEPPFDPTPYEAYGATVQAWGGWPWSESDIASWQEWIQDHHDAGIYYDSTVNLVTAMPYGLSLHPELQDATCLDIEGNKIVVPYISDTWEGVPAYWSCINNPVWRNHLVDRVGWAKQAGADGIHLDDTPANGLPIMLWQEAGCFCDHCNEGFRQWLALRYSVEELAQLGISDIETFDYRATVQSIAPTVASFSQSYIGGQIPLSADFHEFQLESAAEMVHVLKESAESDFGDPVPVSGNVPYLYPYTLKAVSALDSLVTENHFDPASNEIPDTLTANYKLAGALDQTMIAVPGPDSFSGVDGKWGLYKLWIAHAYALGQNLVSPDFVPWVPSLDPPTEVLGSFYLFVREHAHLLDDYEPIEQVGVLYSNTAARQAVLDRFGFYASTDEEITSPVCGALLDANIPFGVAAAGDAFLAQTLTEEELSSRFELLVVPQAGLIVDSATEDSITEVNDFEGTSNLSDMWTFEDGLTGSLETSDLPPNGSTVALRATRGTGLGILAFGVEPEVQSDDTRLDLSDATAIRFWAKGGPEASAAWLQFYHKVEGVIAGGVTQAFAFSPEWQEITLPVDNFTNHWGDPLDWSAVAMAQIYFGGPSDAYVIIDQVRAVPPGVQQRVVDQWLTDGRAMIWSGDVQDVLDAATPWVAQEPERDVWILPRKNEGKPGAPLVVHVVNHSYSVATDSVILQTSVSLELQNDLLGGVEVQKVTAYSPETEPEVLPFDVTPDTLSVTIPKVQYWTILEVTPVPAPSAGLSLVVSLVALALLRRTGHAA